MHAVVGRLKMPLFDVPTRLKKNLKHSSENLLGLLGAQKKEIGAALQTLLGRVRLHFFDISYGISPHQLSKCKCYVSLMVFLFIRSKQSSYGPKI